MAFKGDNVGCGIRVKIQWHFDMWNLIAFMMWFIIYDVVINGIHAGSGIQMAFEMWHSTGIQHVAYKMGIQDVAFE